MIRILFAVLVVLSFSACKGSSIQRVLQPRQEVAVEDSSGARVYFLRSSQAFGRRRMLRVLENEREIGRIAQGRYLCWETTPSRKLITAVFERRPIDGGDITGVLDLSCEPGQVYYCVAEQAMNDKGAPKLRTLSAAEGRALVEKQRPAKVDL